MSLKEEGGRRRRKRCKQRKAERQLTQEGIRFASLAFRQQCYACAHEWASVYLHTDLVFMNIRKHTHTQTLHIYIYDAPFRPDCDLRKSTPVFAPRRLTGPARREGARDLSIATTVGGVRSRAQDVKIQCLNPLYLGLSACLFSCLSICLSVYLSYYIYICLSLSLYPNIYLSFYLSM